MLNDVVPMDDRPIFFSGMEAPDSGAQEGQTGNRLLYVLKCLDNELWVVSVDACILIEEYYMGAVAMVKKLLQGNVLRFGNAKVAVVATVL